MAYVNAEMRSNLVSENPKKERKTGNGLVLCLIVLLFASMLVSASSISGSAVGNSNKSEIIDSLKDLSKVINQDMPKQAFSNPKSADGQRGAFVNKIGAVINQIEAGAYTGAVAKLRNDLSNAIRQWIADEEWEKNLLDMLDAIINLIEGEPLPNLLPVANFTASAESILTGEVIKFDASGSIDPDGYIVSYFWVFGDGSNATGVTVNHTYVDDGTFNVTLTVVDDDGAVDTATSSITVLNRLPFASFTENATTVLTDETISFNASNSIDPDGNIVLYHWDLGDGTTAAGVNVKHTFEDDGLYNVILIVTDNDGESSTSSATITVLNRPPIPVFTKNATLVNENEVIKFDASGSIDPDGYIVSYFWVFGDGSNATGVTVNYKYANIGTFNVTLTVTDDDGASSSQSAATTILAAMPTGLPSALLTAIVLGIVTLTATLLYALYRIARKKPGS